MERPRSVTWRAASTINSGIKRGVPIDSSYIFCDDQTTAELALLISRMTDEERRNLIEALKSSPGGKHADKK